MNNYGRSKLNNIIKTIENAKQTKSVEQNFLDELEVSIVKQDDKHKHIGSKMYKPSGMNCMRKCFYTLIGLSVPDEIKTYSSVGICESGTDRHIRIQEAICAMRDNGFDCDYLDVETYINQHGLSDKLEVVEKSGMETKIHNNKLNMSFLTDGLIKYKNVYYVFEFKTETSLKWRKRTGIDESHISQGVAYSENFNIPQVIFVYENRDTCEKKAYILNVTEEMRKERITGFIDECNSYIESRIVPPTPTDVNILKKCKYCEYSGRCATDGLGSKAFV